MRKITLQSWSVLVVGTVGIFLCCVPFMFANYSQSLAEGEVIEALSDPSVSEALLCSIIASIPILIDLFLDYSILSTASHETYHWISRFIFMLSLVIRSVMLWITLRTVDSDTDNVAMFVIMGTVRLLLIVMAILYYMSSTNLENSIFNVRNCLIILVLWIVHRFFAVIEALFPHTKFVAALSGACFCFGYAGLAFCGGYWMVGQYLVRKSEIGQRSNNFVCSQMYIFSGLGEGLAVILINWFVDGSGSIAAIKDRSAATLVGSFYVQLSITILITLIPGRYAKQESLSYIADSQARRNFIRHVTNELKLPLNTIAVGLKVLEQHIVSVIATHEGGDMDRFGVVYELQETCEAAMSMLNLTLKNEGRRSDGTAVNKPLLTLDVVATKAVPFLLATIKTCSLHAHISGNTFVYDIGCNELQDSVCYALRDVFLYVDAQRMERVIVTFISNAIKYATIRSEITFKVALLEGEYSTSASRLRNLERESSDQSFPSNVSSDEDRGSSKKKKNTGSGKTKHKRGSSESKYQSEDKNTPMLRFSVLFHCTAQDVDRIYYDILQFKLNQVDGSGGASFAAGGDHMGNTTEREDEDCGLGLYIAKQVIELHGGSIGFSAEHSEVGGSSSTAFFIDLPYTRQAQLELMYLQQQQHHSGNKGRKRNSKVDVAYDRTKNTYKAVAVPRRITIASGAQRNKVHVIEMGEGGTSHKPVEATKQYHNTVDGGKSDEVEDTVNSITGNAGSGERRGQGLSGSSLFCLQEEAPVSRIRAMSEDSAGSEVPLHHVVKFKPVASNKHKLSLALSQSVETTEMAISVETAPVTNVSVPLRAISKVNIFSSEAIAAALLAANPASGVTRRVLLVTDDHHSQAEETLFSDAAECGLYFGGRMGSHTLINLLDAAVMDKLGKDKAAVGELGATAASRRSALSARVSDFGSRLLSGFGGRKSAVPQENTYATKTDSGVKEDLLQPEWFVLLSYDLILVDSSSMGGEESSYPVLCRRLREDINYNGVIFLLITGRLSDDRHEQNYMLDLADSSLHDNFTIEQLLARFLKVVEECPQRILKKSNSKNLSRNNSSSILLNNENSGFKNRPAKPSTQLIHKVHDSNSAIPSSQAINASSFNGGTLGPSLHDLTAFSYLAMKPSQVKGHINSSPEHTVNGTESVFSDCMSPMSVGGTAKRRVLIVDDSVLSRKMLRRRLEALGFLCDEVADGLDAVAVIERSLLNPADDYVRHRCSSQLSNSTNWSAQKHNQQLSSIALISPIGVRKSGAFLSPKHAVSSAYHCTGRVRVDSDDSNNDLVRHMSYSSVLFHTYDLVVLDYEMQSDLKGSGAAQLIRDLGYQGAIIGLTAHTTPSIAAVFIAAGADDVLTKPLDTRLFMTTYRAIVKKEKEYYCQSDDDMVMDAHSSQMLLNDVVSYTDTTQIGQHGKHSVVSRNRALVIDSSPSTRKVIVCGLNKMGFECDEAATWDEGVKQLQCLSRGILVNQQQLSLYSQLNKDGEVIMSFASVNRNEKETSNSILSRRDDEDRKLTVLQDVEDDDDVSSLNNNNMSNDVSNSTTRMYDVVIIDGAMVMGNQKNAVISSGTSNSRVHHSNSLSSATDSREAMMSEESLLWMMQQIRNAGYGGPVVGLVTTAVNNAIYNNNNNNNNNSRSSVSCMMTSSEQQQQQQQQHQDGLILLQKPFDPEMFRRVFDHTTSTSTSSNM